MKEPGKESTPQALEEQMGRALAAVMWGLPDGALAVAVSLLDSGRAARLAGMLEARRRAEDPTRADEIELSANAQPGKYEMEARELRVRLAAWGVALLVLQGSKGDGFSIQVEASLMPLVPKMLRDVAAQMEIDLSPRPRPDLN